MFVVVNRQSVPVSGDRDVGGGEELSLCLWYIPPLSSPEVAGQLCLFSWVPDIQVHEAAWQLPIHAWAVSRTSSLQDPSKTGVILVPQTILENKAKQIKVISCNIALPSAVCPVLPAMQKQVQMVFFLYFTPSFKNHNGFFFLLLNCLEFPLLRC